MTFRFVLMQDQVTKQLIMHPAGLPAEEWLAESRVHGEWCLLILSRVLPSYRGQPIHPTLIQNIARHIESEMRGRAVNKFPDHEFFVEAP